MRDRERLRHGRSVEGVSPRHPAALLPWLQVAAGNAQFPGISRGRTASLRQRGRARVREDPRLPRRPLAVRAAHVRARAGRGRPRRRGVHARLLPPRAGSLPRGDGDEAVARHPQEPQAAQAAGALSRGARSSSSTSATSSGSRPATGCARRAERAGCTAGDGSASVYLGAAEIAARVRELGAELARDYADREPVLVGSLKACVPFVADLSRAIADRARARLRRARRLRRRRDGRPRADPLPQGPRPARSPAATCVIVDEVVDTGLTMHYLAGRSRCASPRRSPARRSSTARTGGSSTTSRSATSASRSRTSSSSATASTSTSAGATCPTCTSSSSRSAVAQPESLAMAKLWAWTRPRHSSEPLPRGPPDRRRGVPPHALPRAPVPRPGVHRLRRLHRPGQLRDEHRRRLAVRLHARLGDRRLEPDGGADPDALGEARDRDAARTCPRSAASSSRAAPRVCSGSRPRRSRWRPTWPSSSAPRSASTCCSGRA